MQPWSELMLKHNYMFGLLARAELCSNLRCLGISDPLVHSSAIVSSMVAPAALMSLYSVI